MEKMFSYRIVKIGGKAVSVALTALGLMVGAAQAGEVYLGSALGQVAVGDGSTRTVARWNGGDYWDIYDNPSAAYTVSTSRSGDIFYGSTVTYSGSNGVAYTVYPWSSNPMTGSFGYLDDSFPWVGAFDAQRSGTFSLNTFGNIADTNVNNYHFGAGVTVGDSSRGAKAYASGTYYTTGGDGYYSIVVNAGAAAGAATAYAIDINGEAAFYGNAEINGDSRAQSFTIYGNNSMFNGSVNAVAAVAVNGNDNVFNGPVTADQVNLSGNNTSFAGNVTVANGLNFLNGVTASMTNGSDVIGAVNMGANDVTLRLSDTSQILGNVTASGVNGTLIFEGSGAVTGTIGATGALASLKEIRLNGADTVDLNNSSQAAVVNYVNYQAAATLTARGGLALNQGSTENQVAFNQHDGILQLAGNLTGVEGRDVVTTTGNNIGTVTMVGGTQSITGNIGADGHAIKTLNIGGTAYSGFDTDAVSTTTVSGDVYAQSIVLQNTNLNSSELKMASGYNLTGEVTTAEAGWGVLSMLGGTQAVTGNIGATGALAAVNAGATAGNASLNGNVFATTLNVTGTGTVNLNGNFTGTSISYDAVGAGGADGTVNLADGKTVTGAVSNDTGTAGNGVFTFVKNGTIAAGYDIGSSAATSLKLVNIGDVAGTDAGVVTTDTIWATTTAVNNNSTLNVRSSKDINGAVTTETNNTGTVTLVGGNQTVTGTVGAAGKWLATVNAGTTAGNSTLGGNVFATTLNVTGTGTVNLNGNFTGTSISYDAVSAGGADGTVNLADGKTVTAAVSNDTGTAGNGVFNFVKSGSIAAGYDIGSSAATSLKLVNVGAVAGSVAGVVTTDTIWATTTAVNNNSTLNVRSGKDINGVVTTETNNTGTVTLAGGNQTVTGTVGAVGALLATVNAGANAGNSTFSSNVSATRLNVTGTGTVNLNGNFTGTSISYNAVGAGGADGTVNLADGKTVTAAVSNDTGTAGNGVFNFVKNGTMAAGYDIGASTATSLKLVNVGDVAGANAGVVTTNTIWATTTAVNNDSTLNVRSGKNINGAVTTEGDGTGTVTLAGGNQAVTGSVGASGASLATVNAAQTGAVTTLQGMVYANTLNFSGNGTTVLNGTNGGSAVGGLVGTVDFNAGTGELQIGNAVNLTAGVAGIQFADANAASMVFNGSSTVTGVLGAAATGATLANSTLQSIYAGVAGQTVTFGNDVHVSNHTFHVSGTGTVNLQGDLYGPLVYDADGVVNVSNGQSIRNDGTAVFGTVKTGTNNTGTLNYLGNTTLSNDLGESGTALKAVNFHSDGTVPAVTQIINKNIYATTTTVGNATTGTTANITTNAYLGNSLTLAAANVTLNTANQDVAQVAAGTRIAGANANTLTFANTPLADGRLSTTATVTKSTTGTGVITTNGATLNFSVAAQAWAANAGGALDANAASSITGAAGSSLVMNGNEKVNIALLGSLKNNQSHTLIGVGTATGAQTGTATDNSYVIDSVLSRNSSGDLVVTFTRDSNSYVTKSATAGHSSNGAAVRLGALGAAGTAYSADMQLVLNKLDLDQWGYGNNQAHLATEVKRLAPIANNSDVQAALASTTSVLNSVGERLSVLRGDVDMVGMNGNGRQMGTDNTGWVKLLGSSGKAQAIGTYDGYKVTNSGLVAGADGKVGNGVVGGSFSYVTSNISQQDFRLGDASKMNSGTVAVYGTQEYGDVFVDAALAFSQHKLEGKRVTALARMAQADVDMNQTTLKLSAGYRMDIDDSKQSVLTPMVSVEAASLKQKAYTETGADALSLNVDSKTVSRTRTSLGLRFNTVIETANTTFYPELMVAVNRNNGMSNTDVVANYMGDFSANKSFVTTGVALPKASYTLGAGLRFATSKTSEVQIGYRYEGGNGLSSSTAQLRGAWSF